MPTLRSLALCSIMPVLMLPSLNAQRSVDLDLHYTTQYLQIAEDCVSCQWLNGGGVELQVMLTRHFAAAFDATITGASNIRRTYSITPQSYDLQQTTYLAGVKYFLLRPELRLRPFADFLIGGVYDTGALAPGNTSAASSSALAAQAGGGLSLRLNHRLSLTPLRIDYLLTTYNNPGQNAQSALRLSTGISFSLKKR